MRSQTPPGLRKSGIPDSVEIPAPVKTTARVEPSMKAARRSTALSLLTRTMCASGRRQEPNQSREQQESDDGCRQSQHKIAGETQRPFLAPFIIEHTANSDGEEESKRRIKLRPFPRAKGAEHAAAEDETAIALHGIEIAVLRAPITAGPRSEHRAFAARENDSAVVRRPHVQPPSFN